MGRVNKAQLIEMISEIMKYDLHDKTRAIQKITVLSITKIIKYINYFMFL